MARKQTEISDSPVIDYRDPAVWPSHVPDYATAMAILASLWSIDRAYSVPDLTVMAQARFEVSRQRRLPAYYLDSLRKVHRRHLAREAAKAQSGEPFPVPGHPAPAPVTTGLVQEITPLQAGQIAQLAQEAEHSAGFIVRR